MTQFLHIGIDLNHVVNEINKSMGKFNDIEKRIFAGYVNSLPDYQNSIYGLWIELSKTERGMDWQEPLNDLLEGIFFENTTSGSYQKFSRLLDDELSEKVKEERKKIPESKVVEAVKNLLNGQGINLADYGITAFNDETMAKAFTQYRSNGTPIPQHLLQTYAFYEEIRMSVFYLSHDMFFEGVENELREKYTGLKGGDGWDKGIYVPMLNRIHQTFPKFMIDSEKNADPYSLFDSCVRTGVAPKKLDDALEIIRKGTYKGKNLRMSHYGGMLEAGSSEFNFFGLCDESDMEALSFLKDVGLINMVQNKNQIYISRALTNDEILNGTNKRSKLYDAKGNNVEFPDIFETLRQAGYQC